MERVFIFLIGLFTGSFLGVLADRLPRGESVVWGLSHCESCGTPLNWYELIPVVSYVRQKGKCTHCGKPFSVQYPLVELVTGFGFAYLSGFYLTPLIVFLAACTIFSALLVIFIADLKYQIIPDSMIVAGSVGALVIQCFSPTVLPSLLVHLASAAGSFAFLWALWAVTHGRGMGFGDVKFAALMGLLLGFPSVVVAFYVAFLTGAAAGVILILRGRAGLKSKIAFGPFLVGGTVVAFFWSGYILAWWKAVL